MDGVKTISIGDKDYPIKWNARARSKWEDATGVKYLDLGGQKDKSGNWIKEPYTFSTKDSAIMCLEILREGHRQEKKNFTLDLDIVFDWLDDYNLENQIAEKVFTVDAEEEKK